MLAAILGSVLSVAYILIGTWTGRAIHRTYCPTKRFMDEPGPLFGAVFWFIGIPVVLSGMSAHRRKTKAISKQFTIVKQDRPHECDKPNADSKLWKHGDVIECNECSKRYRHTGSSWYDIPEGEDVWSAQEKLPARKTCVGCDKPMIGMNDFPDHTDYCGRCDPCGDLMYVNGIKAERTAK